MTTIISSIKGDKNKIATVIGGILGASTQEDNGNEILTIPIGIIIGALTGASMSFSSPVVFSNKKSKDIILNYRRVNDLKVDYGKVFGKNIEKLENLYKRKENLDIITKEFLEKADKSSGKKREKILKNAEKHNNKLSRVEQRIGALS